MRAILLWGVELTPGSAIGESAQTAVIKGVPYVLDEIGGTEHDTSALSGSEQAAMVADLREVVAKHTAQRP